MARKKARCGEAEAGQSKRGNERNLSLRGARECDRVHMVIQFTCKHSPRRSLSMPQAAPASVLPAVFASSAGGPAAESVEFIDENGGSVSVSKDAHEIRMQRSPYPRSAKLRTRLSSVDSTVIANSFVRHRRAMSFAQRFAQAADFDAGQLRANRFAASRWCRKKLHEDDPRHAFEAWSEVRGGGRAPASGTSTTFEHGRERAAGPLDRRALRKALGSGLF